MPSSTLALWYRRGSKHPLVGTRSELRTVCDVLEARIEGAKFEVVELGGEGSERVRWRSRWSTGRSSEWVRKCLRRARR